MRVLFLGKRDDHGTNQAKAWFEKQEWECCYFLGRRPEPIPERALAWQGDLLVSYLSPWVVPASLLARASTAAINFHPGSPHYPGIGCTNFALYEEATEFGVTCHHMLPAVDTGRLIDHATFPVAVDETVWSLTQKTYTELENLFVRVMAGLRKNGKFSESADTWTRRPFRRHELETLCRIRLGMPLQEIIRRIRAVTFPNMPGAVLRHGTSEVPISYSDSLEILRTHSLFFSIWERCFGSRFKDSADAVDLIAKL